MIPSEKTTDKYRNSFKFFLLTKGDKMIIGDEFYNNSSDKWIPVANGYLGEEFDPKESKPVRRLNPNFDPSL